MNQNIYNSLMKVNEVAKTLGALNDAGYTQLEQAFAAEGLFISRAEISFVAQNEGDDFSTNPNVVYSHGCSIFLATSDGDCELVDYDKRTLAGRKVKEFCPFLWNFLNDMAITYIVESMGARW